MHLRPVETPRAVGVIRHYIALLIVAGWTYQVELIHRVCSERLQLYHQYSESLETRSHRWSASLHRWRKRAFHLPLLHTAGANHLPIVRTGV